MYYPPQNYQQPPYDPYWQPPQRPVKEPEKQRKKGDKAVIALSIIGLVFILGSIPLFAFFFYDDASGALWSGIGVVSFGMFLILIGLAVRKQVLAAIVIPVCIVLMIVSLHYYYTVSLPSSGRYVNMYSAYSDANCSYPWASTGSDGSYLIVDSNPYDCDSSNISATKYYDNVVRAIRSLNSYFGLPYSLYKEMIDTTATMGRQTESYPSIGVEVIWSYHPDKGLEVMYITIR